MRPRPDGAPAAQASAACSCRASAAPGCNRPVRRARYALAMRREPPPPDLREYRLATGQVVLVGKTDADNERLSLAIARPNERGFTLKKADSRGHIDAPIALALDVAELRGRKKPRPPLVVL